MIIRSIVSNIEQSGYQSVRIDRNGIYVYFVIINEKVYVVSLVDFERENEIKKEEYADILRSVRTIFTNQNMYDIEMISIICTWSLEQIYDICSVEDSFWIVDLDERRLIIYENQTGEFLNLRNLVEYAFEPPSWVKNSSLCNNIIIGLNVLIFLIIELTGSSENLDYMLDWGAMYWPYVIINHQYFRLLTHMFLHFGVAHLFNNMLVLAFVGSHLEHIVGRVKFLIIYLVSGVLAGVASMEYNMLKNTIVESAGASGAIFGVVGAMLYIVAVNKGKVPNISTRRLAMFIFVSLYGGLATQQVDNTAHFGGIVSGFILAILLYRKSKVKGSEQ